VLGTLGKAVPLQLVTGLLAHHQAQGEAQGQGAGLLQFFDAAALYRLCGVPA